MRNPQMDPAKAEAWLKILNDPRLQKMLDNGRETRDKLAEEIFKRHYISPGEK